MTQPVGIDFGTTNSVVAVYAGGAVDVVPIDQPPGRWAGLGMERIFPSVLGVVDGATVTCGWAAKEQAVDKLEAVKRLFATEEMVTIGGRELSIELAAATLFGQLRIGAETSGVSIEQAVVTIPANSRGLARYRTRLCAGLAGMKVVALINEPTAAAMAHSISAEDDQTILVFDWGGGTLDVTILETIAGVFMERASKGIQRSGGIDLDRLFEAALHAQIADSAAWTGADRAMFRLNVERAKIELSSKTETNIELPTGGFVNVTRSQLEDAIRAKIDETGRPIDQCLRDLKVDASAIDHVVLVGGSSKIPLLRQFVAEKLGKDPTGGVDPLTAVAEGAAIAAAILDGQLDADFFVGTEHALGTIALNEQREELEFSVLIPRNRSLPARERASYSPVRAHQDSVNVRVIEGDPEVELDHPDNVVLKEWAVAIDPTREIAQAGFDIVYDYDVEGILHVTMIDQLTGDELLRDDVSFGITKDKAGLVRTAQQLRQTLETGLLAGQTAETTAVAAAPSVALDAAAVELVARVRTQIIPFVDAVEQERLEALCLALESSSSGGSAESDRQPLEHECRQYAYLF
jgi:molecular chaperone DnaK (HSP70)